MSGKCYFTKDHKHLLHLLLDHGEIDRENTSKKALQNIFTKYPAFADFQDGNKYRAFRVHLNKIISERAIAHAKAGKRRTGKI